MIYSIENLIMIAREVRSAVSWMRIDRMSLQKILWSECFTSGTFESVNLENFFAVASSCFLACLLLPNTASD